MCLEGQRACPPEDVGSTPGYYHFLEVIRVMKSMSQYLNG